MDPKIEHNKNIVRDVRDGALGGALVALACLMDGVIPGTSEQIVNTLWGITIGGLAVGFGAECLLEHAEAH